jgi:hypothetical protein
MTNGIRIPSDVSVLVSYFLKIRDIFFDPTENIKTMKLYHEQALESRDYEETMSELKSAIFRFHTGVPLGISILSLTKDRHHLRNMVAEFVRTVFPKYKSIKPSSLRSICLSYANQLQSYNPGELGTSFINLIAKNANTSVEMINLFYDKVKGTHHFFLTTDPTSVRTAVNHFLNEYARGNGSNILSIAASRMVSNLQSAEVVEIPSLQEIQETIIKEKDDPNSMYYYTPREFNEEVKIDRKLCMISIKY